MRRLQLTTGSHILDVLQTTAGLAAKVDLVGAVGERWSSSLNSTSKRVCGMADCLSRSSTFLVKDGADLMRRFGQLPGDATEVSPVRPSFFRWLLYQRKGP
ncbi:MAG: hypothetical protein R2788_04485 [Saprospiraceae bacterium]